MIKKIAILGSTGSIGRSAVDVITRNPDRMKAVALSAKKSVDELLRQVKKLKPEYAVIYDGKLKQDVVAGLNGTRTKVLSGLDGIMSIVKNPAVDVVVSAMVGGEGLIPTLAAVESGKTVAIANKETLVMAGGIIMSSAKKHNARILPIDSEHSAIHQCLRGNSAKEVRKIILTASGGPFLRLKKPEMKKVAPELALKHPTWNMGRKVTVDCATLMNKGLELIEAVHLFGIEPDKIDIVIHPSSVIHSLVEFVDGSVIAQMSPPDMRFPIQYALTYPDRIENRFEKLDLLREKKLEFFAPDFGKFPCLRIAREAIEEGGTMPAVMSASNEIAVELFLSKKIGFLQISALIEKVMSKHKTIKKPDIEDVLESHDWAKRTTLSEAK